MKNFIRNGDFLEWPNGTSLAFSPGAPPMAVSGDLSFVKQGAPVPDVTISRQQHAVLSSIRQGFPKYYLRVTPSVAVGLGASDKAYLTYNFVETLDRQVAQGAYGRFTFWARSSVNREIAIRFVRNFGTGGSNNNGHTSETLVTKSVQLTTGWKKYQVDCRFPAFVATYGSDASVEARIYLQGGSNELGDQALPSWPSATVDFSQVALTLTQVGEEYETDRITSIYSTSGRINILDFAGVGDGVTDNTTAWTNAKVAAGANGVVYFPANVNGGAAAVYYFSGTTDLTGAYIVTDPGVILSVNQTTGILYRNIKAASDIDLTVRAKNKTYFIPKNQREFSLLKRNVSRTSYTSGAALSFLSDFTTSTMNFNSATPGAPGTAPTVTANKYTIETAVVATTVYSGPWIRPKVGQTVKMCVSTVAAQSSGHAQAVICDSTGVEYCGVEVIDTSNGLKSLPYEVNLVRMTGGTRTRITRKAVRDRNWELGHNGTAGQSVVIGVKMVTPNTAEFFVNHTRIGRLSLNSGNNADRIFFGHNGAYSGALNGFFDPVAYEDKIESEQQALNIAVFGDSIPAGSSTTLPWPELLEHHLEGVEGIGAVTVTNYAVSGATSADQVTTMNAAGSLAGYNVVVIAVGINDIVQGVLADTYDANLAYLITHAQAAGCSVIVSLPPMFSSGSNDVRGGVIRGRCQRVALSNNVRVADPLNLIGNNIDVLGVGDLIHPTIRGNMIHAQAVAKEIAVLYASSQPQVLSGTRRVNGSLRTVGTAAPTTGFFRVGDVVENSAPAAGGNIGWVYTAAGWKTYGVIAA